jgi:hypothetical protein
MSMPQPPPHRASTGQTSPARATTAHQHTGQISGHPTQTSHAHDSGHHHAGQISGHKTQTSHVHDSSHNHHHAGQTSTHVTQTSHAHDSPGKQTTPQTSPRYFNGQNPSSSMGTSVSKHPVSNKMISPKSAASGQNNSQNNGQIVSPRTHSSIRARTSTAFGKTSAAEVEGVARYLVHAEALFKKVCVCGCVCVCVCMSTCVCVCIAFGKTPAGDLEGVVKYLVQAEALFKKVCVCRCMFV